MEKLKKSFFKKNKKNEEEEKQQESVPSYLQQASHANQNYDLLWIDGNIQSVENQRTLYDLKKVGFVLIPIQSLDELIKKTKKIKQKCIQKEKIIIVSGSLKQDVTEYALENQPHCKSIIVYCGNIKYHIEYVNKNSDIIYAITDQLQRLA